MNALERFHTNTQKMTIVDVGLSVIFFALAIAARLPHFTTIPIISDESREVLWALDIARGAHFPLVATDAYDGPLFAYSLALLFRVFGVSSELPRVYVLVVGALTVVTTYWLGKQWANRFVGIITALLMLTAGTHIFVNSHLAWSNSTTPLYTTLTLLAFTRALSSRSTRAWLVTGALYGLALHTHPSVIMLAPAFALTLLANSQTRAQMKTRAPYLALIVCLVAYSPVLWHNALYWGTARASIATAARREYAFGLPESVGEYTQRLALHAGEMARAVASDFNPETLSTIFPPLTWAIVFALLIGLLLAWKRKNYLPLFAFGSTLALLALLNKRAYFPYDTRYFAFLLPIAYVAMGMTFDAIARTFWNFAARFDKWTLTPSISARVRFVSLSNLARLALMLVLSLTFARVLVHRVAVLDSVYNFFLVNQFTSAEMIAIAKHARAANPPHVWVDRQLEKSAYWMCNGVTAGEAVAYLVTLEQVAVSPLPRRAPALAPLDWLIVTPKTAEKWRARARVQEITTTSAPRVHCAPAPMVVLQIIEPPH